MICNPETPGGQPTSPDDKVLKDLLTLEEQLGLCQSMLAETGDSASVDANEALLAVIGFLEACVPRMVELIEAAAQGALGEGAFERCLQVNDRLTNVLADVDKPPSERQPLTAAASAGASGGGSDSALVAEMENASIGTAATTGGGGGGKTSGMTDEDGAALKPASVVDPFAAGPDLLAPSPPSNPFANSDGGAGDLISGGTPAAKAGDTDDDFDAFFRDRTGTGGGEE